ncbi:unnamed protein product [Linum tenue]|uniref:TF-B3 domain-containing protein n=1 Tax=Linum tenue TaxID=586396 RepID=A0AAV0ICA7_9ROSI|nr:unnamed protein product [Linum tenue]
MRHYSSSLHGEEDDDHPLIHHQQQQETHQIWDPEAAQAAALLDDSIFYTGADDFPPLLPDFPCMSSSSSSSSTPAPLKTTATMSCSSTSSASSSAASWAALRSDADHDDDDNRRRYYNNKDHQVVNHQIEIEMASNNNDNNNDSNCCYDYHHLNNNNNNTDLQVDTPSGGGALSSTASMEVAHHAPPSEQGVDCCMDVMDELGYMDLLDTNDFFDPSSIFQGDHQNLLLPADLQPQHPDHDEQMMTTMMMTDNDNPTNNNGIETTTTTTATQLLQGAEEEEDLGSVFLEWLKNNKENVSAEDLRRVKIKKSTIDSAARRLGGGREAMKQLVKLVLEWVQTNHLHRRTTTTTAAADVSASSDPVPPPPSYTNQQVYQLVQEPGPDPNPIQGPWVGPPVPQYPDLAAGGVSVGYPPNIGYGVADPFARRTGPNFGNYPAAADYNQVIEPAPSWPGSQFAMFPAAESQLGSGQMHAFPGYPYLPAGMGLGGGDNSNTTLVRMGSSATKEARKKRMARQRRFLSHHHRNHHHHHQSQHQAAAGGGQHHGGFVEHPVGPTSQQQQQQQGNLVYWPPAHQGSSGLVAVASGPAPAADGSAVQNADRPGMQNQNTQRQGGGASEKRQGWKPEKNLRFLLQKVLKQSDVGNLGRIVLPKKEAETHLPELEARDGISIAMEDIVTSRVWNMRYRFWPNNKSRMYLLENTGDFVRANGLQEGDFIVIYSDIKCGKYLIRGVKVRQSGFKPESKKATGKSQRNGHANSPAAAANALPMAQS